MADQQLRREDLKRMEPREIAQAVKNGRLYDVLNGIERPPATGIDPDEYERRLAEGSADEYVAEVKVAREAAKNAPATNADQGARGTPAVASREWLRTADPHEIRAALKRGDLDAILRGEGPQP